MFFTHLTLNSSHDLSKLCLKWLSPQEPGYFWEMGVTEGVGGRGTEGGSRAPPQRVPRLQVDSEEPVFEAVINWVKHAKKEREGSLPDLLQYVRMPLLTPRYITDVIDTEVSRWDRGVPAASCPAPRTGPPGGMSTPEPVPLCPGQGSAGGRWASWAPGRNESLWLNLILRFVVFLFYKFLIILHSSIR